MNQPTGTRQADRNESREPVGERPALVRPVIRVRSPLLEAPVQAPPSRGGPAIALDDLVRVVGSFVVPVIIVGIPFSLVANGDWLGVALVITIASVTMRNAARRISFTFADGFLAFRPGDSERWPRGVQEEYDIHYSWPSNGRLSTGRSTPSH